MRTPQAFDNDFDMWMELDIYVNFDWDEDGIEVNVVEFNGISILEHLTPGEVDTIKEKIMEDRDSRIPDPMDDGDYAYDLRKSEGWK